MLLTPTGVRPDDLHAVLDLLDEGVLLVDAAWRVTTANAEAARILGAPVDGVVGRLLWDLDSVLAGTPEEAAFHRAMAGEALSIELRRGEGPDGPRSLVTRLLPRPDGLAITLRDVSDQRARDELTDRLARLAQALSRAVDVNDVVTAIVDHGLVFTGAASGVVGALAEDGASIRPLGSFGLADEAAALVRPFPLDAPTLMGEAARTGRLVVVENAAERERRFPPHETPESHLRGGAGVGVPLVAGGRTVGALSLIYPEDRPFDDDARAILRAKGDLCAHALARAQLLDAERAARAEAERLRAEFAATFDHAPIGVAHTDRDHRWLRFNRKLCEITGYSADELRGLDWRAITHPHDLAEQLALEQRMLSGEIPGFAVEKRYIRRDGSVVWVRLATSTVQQDDQGVYSVAAIEDITERRRAEADSAFLADLDRRIRPMTSVDEITTTTVELVAGYLAADRCLLTDIDEVTSTSSTLAEWARPGLPVVGGTRPLERWAFGAVSDSRVENRAVRIEDAATDPRLAVAADAFSAAGIRSLLSGLYVQGDRWVAVLSVSSVAPRAWRDDEATLIQAVVDRVWPQVVASRAARQLQRSEERYRAIVASTTSTVFRLDRDGRTDDAFAAWWEKLTGQGREALSGWGWLDVVAPEDRDRVRAEQERGLADRSAFSFTYRLTTAGGEERHLLVRCVPLLAEDGSVREWFGTVTDVTTQRGQEAALARQANLLDQAYDAFIAWELDGPILLWNQGAERLYGFTQGEALGRSTHELLRTTHPGGREALLAELEATGATEVELSHVTKDGRAVTVRSRHQLVLDGARRIVLEANRDVTELKALERAQQDFTAAASHDLKNPISIVKAEAQLMLRRMSRGGPTESDRLIRGLTTIDRVTDSLAGLVDDLVDVAVLRSGRPIELLVASADLGPLTERAVSLHRPRYGGEIVISLPDHPVVASVDERRMDRVLGNLLGNAVKFSPGLGRIHVELRPAEREGRPVAEIVVRDTGVGIPVSDLPVVFERFQRGSNVAGVAGTGIGLSGARQIVELHGGTITVESAEGVGSAFTVTLPLSADMRTPRPGEGS